MASLVDHVELRRALAKLSKRQREVVVLRHLAGFSERETALALGCSNGTVKQHASRGLATLRDLLQDAPAEPEQPLPRMEGQG
jgi:RNA polymerase sigma factor (sigma-70 family)